MMEFGQKRWTSYDVLLVDPFPIEKQHKFTRIWILLQKKNKHGNENFQKKCHFGVHNDEICPKNDQPPMKSCSLTHCNRKATQIKWTPLRKFSKRCLFGAEMMEFGDKRWTSYGVLLVDPFPIETQHKFVQIWILMQKKKSTEMKIFKKMPFRRSKR